MADSDLLTYFTNGLNYWLVQHDERQARENFLWCTEHIDSTQCDVHRALAAIDNKPCKPELIERIYTTLPTWGKLLSALGLEEDKLLITVNLEYVDVEQTLRTRSAAYLGHAVTLLNNHRYDDALQIITAAPAQTPAQQLVKTLIYLRAHRWGDVIEYAQPLLDPLVYDASDQPTGETDRLMQSVGYLMTGVSYAHLGNFTTAVDMLKTADVTQKNKDGSKFHYRRIGAEVCYYLGLIDRAQNNEDDAAVCLNNGLAYRRTDKLIRALSDSSVTLRQTTVELINQRGSYWDVTTEADLNEVTATRLAETRNDLLVEADKELTKQLGMTEVKQQVRRLKSSVAFQQEMLRRGKTPKRQSLHLIFTGPPGTGKSTIAEVLAKALCGLGVCKTDVVLVTSRADFIGDVEGASTKKTREVCDQVDGGLLFIDEAYELVQDRDGRIDPFGQEAITELLLQMERRRDTLIVILAGYERKINRMLATNEGLNSRFSRRIRFHTYSPEEIGEIAELKATERDSILTADARELIVEEAQHMLVCNHGDEKLLDVAGNGRFARNVIEAAEEYRNDRLDGINLASLSDTELLSLTTVDVQQALRDIVDPLIGRSTPIRYTAERLSATPRQLEG